MNVTSARQFRSEVLKNLHFIPKNATYGTRYEHTNGPQLGVFTLYEKPGCYNLGIADYTIEEPFKISFDNPNHYIRFGIVYLGTTSFKLHGKPVSSFSPSSFFVLEQAISGQQVWNRGQHYKGTEITIHEDYFCKKIEEITGQPVDLSTIPVNRTFYYLPLPMVQIIQQLQTLSTKEQLNPVSFEGKILELMGILYQELQTPDSAFFRRENDYETLVVGDRQIQLTPEDISCIAKAHDILSENYANPPTIESLSEQVTLNTQKLKAGFSHMYQLTIREYTTSLKMQAAAILLCTTSMHIHDIGYEVGYSYPANFIKAFRQFFGQTPYQYRQKNQQNRHLNNESLIQP